VKATPAGQRRVKADLDDVLVEMRLLDAELMPKSVEPQHFPSYCRSWIALPNHGPSALDRDAQEAGDLTRATAKAFGRATKGDEQCRR